MACTTMMGMRMPIVGPALVGGDVRESAVKRSRWTKLVDSELKSGV